MKNSIFVLCLAFVNSSFAIADEAVMPSPALISENGDTTIISVGGVELIEVSHKLSGHQGDLQTMQRSVVLLGPDDGSEERGSFSAYGQVIVNGDSRLAARNVGPRLRLNSAFADPVDNRHFYITLGAGGNFPASAKDDVVFHSWDNDYEKPVHHMVLTANGKMGVGTLTPNSTLEVAGYLQLSTTAGGAPPSTDCIQSIDYGRMKVDEVNASLYICTTVGWVAK
ncbi:MAG: hypothetical protein ACI8WB_005876 [Phenylobacterium sp.]|jgi:hypothetical protein